MPNTSIKEMANYLLLSYIRDNHELMIDEAIRKDYDYRQFLQELLEGECSLRRNNSLQRRLHQAHFPNRMTFLDFKTDHFSVEIRQKIRQLQTLEFIEKGENIILVGNPGTGKTALSIALGMRACEEYKTVLFISVPLLMIEISEAMSSSQILQYKKRFERYDLVILDELGYCSFSREAGEVLFNLLSSRNEKRSIIITSNLTMDKWNEVFRDKILTGALIDRLSNRAHLIDMSGESYRIRQTKLWMEKESEKSALSLD